MSGEGVGAVPGAESDGGGAGGEFNDCDGDGDGEGNDDDAEGEDAFDGGEATPAPDSGGGVGAVTGGSTEQTNGTHTNQTKRVNNTTRRFDIVIVKILLRSVREQRLNI